MGNKYYGNQQRGINAGGNDLGGNHIPPVDDVTFGSYSDQAEYAMESGAENQLTGPDYGTNRSGGAHNKVKQLKSDTGDSAVTIEGGEGSEKITLSHATGAGVVIDPDGSIFIIPKGRKGVGIGTNSGPVALSGQRLVLTSDGGIEMNTKEFRLRTSGDFNIIAGGTLNIKAGGFHQNISGSYQNYVAGDSVEVTGGTKRELVAGEKREQISGFYKVDIGDSFTLRAEAKSSMHFQDNMYVVSNKNLEFHSGENTTSISKGETNISSSQGINAISDNTIKMTASDSFSIGSDGEMKLTTQDNLVAYGNSGTIVSSGGRTELTAEDTMQFNYSFSRSPTVPSESGTDVTDIDTISPEASLEAKGASEVEVQATSEIQEKMATYYKYPLIEENYKFGSSGARTANYDLPIVLKGDEV